MAALSSRLQTLLNQQVNLELAASQLYFTAAIWFSRNNYDGITTYLLKESEDERMHAWKVVDYILKRQSGNAVLETLQAHDASGWERPIDVWTDVLAAEEANMARLEALYRACREEGDVNAGQIS